jgi:5-formyltetrahydrofolate cyclo-ligase
LGMELVKVKQAFRRQMLAERAALPAGERADRSRAACRHLLSFAKLAACRTVMAFHPIREELDIVPFLDSARQRGQEVWLPLTVVTERRLIPYRYTGPDMLRPGAYGIMEPDPAKAEEADLAKLDAVLVPGVAFDRQGGRMGYGGGFYDRFLSALDRKPLLIGCGYGLQVVQSVPVEPHDVRLDYLVTEAGVLETGTAGLR